MTSLTSKQAEGVAWACGLGSEMTAHIRRATEDGEDRTLAFLWVAGQPADLTLEDAKLLVDAAWKRIDPGDHRAAVRLVNATNALLQ